MKKHSKLCAIFLTALLSISAVSFSVSAVGEEVDPGGDSSVIVDPVEPEPEPEPEPSPEPEPEPQPDPVYPDSSDSSSYVDPGYSSSDSSYDNNYNYDSSYDYNSNDYDNNYSSSQTYYYSEPSYVGGGQSYVAPSNTAPSASLIKSDNNIDEKTLSSSDWSDISKNLKNANASGSDGDDFNFIKNNNSKGDNGHWMLYVSIVLLALGVAGIAYFVISTVLNKKKRVAVGGRNNAPKSKSAQSAAKAQRYSSNDDYADDYTSSNKKSERRSKYDTAEIRLPKNNSKGGRRYK